MHFLVSLVLIFGFCLLLIVGLLSVLQDLMERDFRAVPSMVEHSSREDHQHQGGEWHRGAAESNAEVAGDVERAPLGLSGGQQS